MARGTSSPPILPGHEFIRVLGSGGFSDVFLYQQHFPKRQVAVKVLLTEDLTDDARNAFSAEANVMAQLSAHPYIVTIFQAAVAEGDRPYLVMEYCSGPSLAEQYKLEPFAVADALQTGIRLSSAIATAHAAGILHRDIKPANVLTNDFGWPALTDFGIASALDEMVPTTTTSRIAAGPASTSGGTASVGLSIPWSPPEMFEDFPDADVRSDLFSLSATLYTLLAGHTPFEIPGRSNGSVDLVGRIARGTITPLKRTDVPASLVAVLGKGMATEREDRFATAVDFGRALQRVELELGYVVTQLDIPNTGIVKPVRSVDAEAPTADETRARGVSTIRAQPVSSPGAAVPIAMPAFTPAPAQPVLYDPTVSESTASENTVARPRDPALSEAPTETVIRTATPIPQHAGEAPPKRRGRGFVIGLAIAAVIVAAGIITAVAVVGTPKQSPTPATSGKSAGGAVDFALPSPPSDLAGVRSADGTTVTFTWKNSDPVAGDRYRWTTATDGTGWAAPSKIASANVTGSQPGARVCIVVEVVRDGQESDGTDPAATACVE